MKNSISKKQINRAIAHLDLEVFGERGVGCFYFIHKPSNTQAGRAIMVAYLNQFSLERWVSEAEGAYAACVAADDDKWDGAYTQREKVIRVGNQWLYPCNVSAAKMICLGHIEALRDVEARRGLSSFQHGLEWEELNRKTVTIVPTSKEGRLWFYERYGPAVGSMELLIDSVAAA